MRAQRAVLHRLAERGEHPEGVGVGVRARGEVAHELAPAAHAEAAGEALSAALVVAEHEEVQGDGAHVGEVVEGHDAAVPEQSSHRVELLEAQGRVEGAGGEDASERPTDLQGLERAPVAQAAAELVDDHAQRRAQGDLVDPGPREALVEAHGLGAQGLAYAHGGVGVSALRDDPRHRDQGLDVVHHRGTLVEPLHGGEGRSRSDHAPQPLDAAQKGRLFAAHIAPGALDDVDVEAERPVRHPECAALSRLAHGLAHAGEGRGVLRAEVDHPPRGADREAREGHALEHAVGVELEEDLVDVAPGVALVGVAHDELLARGLLRGEAPFLCGREARAPAAPQPRAEHGVEHRGARGGLRGGVERVPHPEGAGAVEGRGVASFDHVAQHDGGGGVRGDHGRHLA
ncbi:MAG: hypothetical protein R3A48_15555, partial [Polyangiales bacterium]